TGISGGRYGWAVAAHISNLVVGDIAFDGYEGSVHTYYCPSTPIVKYPPRRKTSTTLEAAMDITLSPNPAHDFARITMDILEETNVEIGLYDMAGKQLQTTHQTYLPGKREVVFRTDQLPAGMYHLQISTDKLRTQRRLVITH
ncbi:MAG: T9SS type A sorting domain-containing protein, partial [Bacteroidota bacterium]